MCEFPEEKRKGAILCINYRAIALPPVIESVFSGPVMQCLTPAP